MRLADWDPFTGEGIRVGWDHANDQMIVEHFQDTTAIIEDNKRALLKDEAHRKQAENDWAHYAKVPNIVIMKWKQELGVDFFNRDHWPKVMSLLNSPEYRYLKRTTYFHDR